VTDLVDKLERQAGIIRREGGGVAQYGLVDLGAVIAALRAADEVADYASTIDDWPELAERVRAYRKARGGRQPVSWEVRSGGEGR
jgi:hypothetical protein